MTKIFPVLKKVISGGPGEECPPDEADISWAERAYYRENQSSTLKLPERFVSRNQQSIITKLPDTFFLRDSRQVTDIDIDYPDTLHSPDALVGRFNSLDPARIGTTNNNMYVDGWVDGIPLNNGVNHGNESPLTVGSDNIIATQADAYVYWDLSRFLGFSAPIGGSMLIRFWIDTATLSILDTVVFDISRKNGARPFNESTLTWNNKPTVGTNLVTRTLAALLRLSPTTPQFQPYDITLSASEYTPFFEDWMMVRIHSSVLIGTPFLVASREHGVVGERPSLSFDFRR